MSEYYSGAWLSIPIFHNCGSWNGAYFDGEGPRLGSHAMPNTEYKEPKRTYADYLDDKIRQFERLIRLSDGYKEYIKLSNHLKYYERKYYKYYGYTDEQYEYECDKRNGTLGYNCRTGETFSIITGRVYNI